MYLQVLMRGLGEGSEARLPDCKAAVFGLTQLLKEAIYRPGPLAGQVLSVLLQFLRQVYAGAYFTTTTCVLRINVSSYSTLSSCLFVLVFTLGAHAQQGLLYFWVCLVCLLLFICVRSSHKGYHLLNGQRRSEQNRTFERFSLKTLRYKARALPLVRSRPFLSLRIRPL